MNIFLAIIFREILKNLGLKLSETSIVEIKKREGKTLLNM